MALTQVPPALLTSTTGTGPTVALSASPTFTGTVVAPTINAGAATALTLQSAGTTAMTIDTSQNIGLGSTTYTSTVPSIYVPNGGIISAGANNYTLAANAKYDSVWKYIITDYATSYKQNSGQHQWSIASSGTAGNSITFTQAMTLDNSGNLGIGSTNPSAYGKLAVDGAIAQVAAAGSYTIDITANSSAVANGGTVSFPNMSGMIVVNSATSASIAIWLVSGGSTSAVSNVNGATGTMTYVSGIAGYRWTNNTGSANTVAFFCVRTRQTA
jgi:hypothetical protein